MKTCGYNKQGVQTIDDFEKYEQTKITKLKIFV